MTSAHSVRPASTAASKRWTSLARSCERATSRSSSSPRASSGAVPPASVWAIPRITSPGPIFYRQPRIGFRGRRFMIVKFRTMKVNSETTTHERYLEHLMVADCPMIKLDEQGDPRLIAGGKILRATGLDELPQIFNVLTGEMSLIGPRPCTVREFERFSPPHRERVNAYPGLTGWWQVNGKNRTTFREMIEMDIFYSRNIPLSLDLRILVRTFPAIRFVKSLESGARNSCRGFRSVSAPSPLRPALRSAR